jgi:hypothetical protein
MWFAEVAKRGEGISVRLPNFNTIPEGSVAFAFAFAFLIVGTPYDVSYLQS